MMYVCMRCVFGVGVVLGVWCDVRVVCAYVCAWTRAHTCAQMLMEIQPDCPTAASASG